MSTPAYTFDARTRRYRNATNGRLLSEKTVTGLRDRFVAEQSAWAGTLADQLAHEGLGLEQWEREVRVRLKKAYTAEYALGRGGVAQLTIRDHGRIGGMLKRQYQYLRGFTEAIADGMTQRQIEARAGLYFSSATQAFERGKAAAWDADLPCYPGDGTTACGTNCRCSWSIRQDGDTVEAHWQLSGGAQHCATCQERADRYNPLVIRTEAA